TNAIKQLLILTGSTIANGLKTLTTNYINFARTISTNIFNGITNGLQFLYKLLISSPIGFFVSSFQKIYDILTALLKPITSVTNSISKLFSMFGSKTLDLVDPKDATDANNIATGIDKLGNEYNQLESELLQTENASHGVYVGLTQINTATPKGLKTVFKEAATEALVLNNVLNTAGSILRNVTQNFKGLTSEALATISFNEKLKASLTALSAVEFVNSGSFETVESAYQSATKNAEVLISVIKQLAITSPFSKDDIAQGVRLAQAFGFVSEEAFNLTRIVTNFVSATGQSGSQIAEIVGVFGQIKQAGKLQAQDMKQLTDRQIAVLPILAKAYGKTVEEIKEAIKNGAIEADDALKVIAKSLDKSFTSIAATQANTFSALISSLGDLKNESLSSFFTPILESFRPFLSGLVELLQSPQIVSTLENLGKTIGDKLTSAFLLLGNVIGTVIGIISIIPKPVKDVIKSFAVFLTIAGSLSLVIGAVYAAFVALVPILGLVFNTFSLTAGASIGLVGAMYSLKNSIISSFSSAAESVSTFTKQSTSSIGKLQKNVDGVKFVNINQQLNAVDAKFKDVLDTFSKSKFNTGTGTTTPKDQKPTIQKGFKISMGDVKELTIFQKALSVVSDIANKAVQGVSILFSFIGGGLKGIGKGLQDFTKYEGIFFKVFDTSFASGGISKLEVEVNNFYNLINGVIQSFSGVNNSLPVRGFSKFIFEIQKMVKYFYELSSVSRLFSESIYYVGNVLKIVTNTIGGILTALGQLAVDIGNAVYVFAQFKDSTTEFNGVVTKNTRAVETLFSTVAESAFNFIKQLVNVFATGFANIGKYTVDFGNAMTKNFKTILTNVFNYGKALVEVFADGITSFASSVVNAIKGLASIISTWMQPHSPPKFLPHIDEWGKETAEVYLAGYGDASGKSLNKLGDTVKGELSESRRLLPDLGDWGRSAANDYLSGFGEADLKNISGFNKSLGGLLESLNFDTSAEETKDVIKSIVQEFSQGVADIKDTGNVSDDVFGNLADIAGDVSPEVMNLVKTYFELSKTTDDLTEVTERYTQQINDAEKAMDSLGEQELFDNESQQLSQLNAQLQNKFLSETQRQAILREIQKVNNERTLRELKKEKSAKDAILDAAKDEVDALDERIDLANEFNDLEDDELTIRKKGDRLDKAKKAKAVKKKKVKEEVDPIKPIEDASDALTDLGANVADLKDQLGGLTGTDSFTQFKDNISSSALAVTGWGDVLENKVSDIKSAFNDTFSNIKDNAFEKLTSVLTFTTDVVTKILDFFNISTSTSNPLAMFEDLGIPITSANKFEAALTKLKETFKNIKLPDWLQKIADYFKTAEGSATLLAGAIATVVGVTIIANLSTFLGLLLSFGAAITPIVLVGAALGSIYEIGQALMNQDVSKYFTNLADSFKNTSSIGENFKAFLSGLLSGSFDSDAFNGLIGNVLSGLSSLFSKIEGFAAFDLSGLFTFNADLSFVENIKIKIGEVITYLQNISFSDIFFAMISSIGSGISGMISSVFTTITGTIGAKVAYFVGILVASFVSNLQSSGLYQSFTAFWEQLFPILKNVGAILAVIVANFIGLIPELPNIVAGLLDILTPILKVINDIINIIINLVTLDFASAFDGAIQLVKDLFFGVGEIIVSVLRIFDSLDNGLVNFIKMAAKAFGLEAIFDPILANLTWLLELIGGLITGGFLKWLFGVITAFLNTSKVV
ncbi:MAG: hypothetical protein E6R13_09825, partial [Spirochaetes bacterium]